MGTFATVISCLLLSIGVVTAQTARDTQRALPQWLTGIIAVVAFLFLAFVAILVNKAWCGESRASFRGDAGKESDYTTTKDAACDSSLEMVRSPEDRNAYDNLTVHINDEKVTTM
ncbi:PDZK1-interacting protein 1 [Genypterus blacodes]|uniref:PDZK1-interacting protein 1 n=1 Tax=Genypterus blacodes TaxID=154954 RepID=UPI003F76ECBE